jgi:hypothetical protein
LGFLATARLGGGKAQLRIKPSNAMKTSSPSDWNAAYAPNYVTARERLVHEARRRGAVHQSWPIDATGPVGEPLCIDYLRFGAEKASRVLIISSGLHGVEGYFGSAVQWAWLMRHPEPRDGVAVVLLHALNPFGFAWRRRFDGENIDPNRNFLLPGEEYRGAPPLYGPIYSLFRMDVPPRRIDPAHAARVAYIIARYGLRQLRVTIPVGQYEFPLGPFFGGKGPCATQRVLASHLAAIWTEAEQVVHVDLHSGLGKWGGYKILIDDAEQSSEHFWWQERFGNELVEVCQKTVTAYPARGSLGPWLRHYFPGQQFHYATLEFGTYRPKRVMDALMAETRAFNCGLLADPRYEWTRQQLLEVFVPTNALWRHSVVEQSLSVLDQAYRALITS